jgi:hypothetical protein
MLRKTIFQLTKAEHSTKLSVMNVNLKTVVKDVINLLSVI